MVMRRQGSFQSKRQIKNRAKIIKENVLYFDCRKKPIKIYGEKN